MPLRIDVVVLACVPERTIIIIIFSLLYKYTLIEEVFSLLFENLMRINFKIFHPSTLSTTELFNKQSSAGRRSVEFLIKRTIEFSKEFEHLFRARKEYEEILASQLKIV